MYQQYTGVKIMSQLYFKEYQKLLPDLYPDLKLQKAGFMIGNPAYLGASPVGILLDDTGALKR